MASELVKCNKCKWVHFIYDPQPDGPFPAEVFKPTSCFRCGNSCEDFSPAEPEDVPDGSTIQAILKRKKRGEL